MMTAVRRTIRIRKNEQQKTNFCEKEIKRQRLVKKKEKKTSIRIQCICRFISSYLVLSLSDSLSVLFRAECGFKKERRKTNEDLKI